MRASIFLIWLLPMTGFGQSQKHTFSGMLNIGNSTNYSIGYKGSYRSSDTVRLGLQLDLASLLQYSAGDQGTQLQRRDATSSIGAWRTLTQLSSIILFCEAEHSLTRRVNLRLSGGLGWKRFIVHRPRLKLELSQAGLLEKLASSNLDETWTIRSSTRLKLITGNRAQISIITFIQPPLLSNTGAPWRRNTVLSSTIQVDRPLTQKLALALGSTLYYQTYQSWLDPRVKPYDATFQIGFTWKSDK